MGGATICAIEGCGRPRRRGNQLCEMHYKRRQRHGDPLFRKYKTSGKGMTVEERLFEQMKVRVGSHWIWTGAVRGRPETRDKYGEMQIDGKMRPIHVVAYEIFIGPIPKGYDIHHTCEDTLCFNPKHLEAIDHLEHLRYHAYIGGRARWS